MVDFRTEQERSQDQLNAQKKQSAEELEATKVLKKLVPEVDSYKKQILQYQAEVRALKKSNNKLKATIETHSQKVKQIEKSVLDKFEVLKSEVNELKRKLVAASDEEIGAYQAMVDKQDIQLSKIEKLVERVKDE